MIQHVAARIPFASGLTVSKEVALPVRSPSGKLFYIHSVLFRIYYSIVSAATSDAVVGRQWAGFLTSLFLEDRNGGRVGSEQPLSGAVLRVLRVLVAREAITKGDGATLGANSNTTVTGTVDLVLPFWQPCLGDSAKRQLMPLASTIANVNLTWALSTFLGTGEPIGATTYCEVIFNLIPADKLESYGRIIYHAKSVLAFLNESVSINGKVLAVALADLANGAATTFGATDFTQFDLAGYDGLQAQRQDIDNPTHALNQTGLRGLAAYALPTAGTADVVPLYMHPLNADLGDLPEERNVPFNLVVGAGAPALTDQQWVMAIIRPPDAAALAENFGKSPNLNVSADDARRAMAASAPAKGTAGPANTASPTARYLRRPLHPATATGRRKIG